MRSRSGSPTTYRAPTMDKLPDTSGILQAAREYAALGLPIIPLNGKVPAVRDWQRFVADAVNVTLWFSPARGANIGLRTGESGYVVIDTDTEEAEAWVRAHCTATPMTARSGAGSLHRYYANPARKEVRNRQGLKGIRGLDVRGHGGYIVLPPSVHPDTGRAYEWLTELRPPVELPRFSPTWVYQRTRRKVHAEALSPSPDFLELRATRWLQTVARESPAVSGQGGHNATFRAACKLVHYFQVGRDAAIRLMLAVYNPCCRPPWSEKEIEHKVDSAIERGRAPS
jgi:hypothetical protein